MKRIIYMAITLNGYISRPNGDVDYFSPAVWGNYYPLVKNRTMIVGRKTYDAMAECDEFSRTRSKAVIVLTKNKRFKPALTEHWVARSARSAMAIARKTKSPEVFIAGGSKANTAFLKDKLVDELILDIEPVMIGRGKPFLTDATFDRKFRLSKVTFLNKNFIRLRYACR